MKLIIVESPTKATTISNFLKNNFIVRSSYGHIRDLPKSSLGVNVEKNFEPKYVIPTKSRKKLNELKKITKDVNKIILATDEDREGEAIAWHLVKALKIDEIENKDYERIVFHEITKSAIEEALKNPRQININLVNAQQSRRILDRLVGYKLSPFLWKKVKRGLSAGRVQSVAVRLICEREKEIKKFKPQEYWKITALLKKEKDNDKKSFEAILYKKDKKIISRLQIKSKQETEKILTDLKNSKYKVKKIEKEEKKQNPLPPFTTSLLQQETGIKLRYSAKLTMRIAQSLYEKGLITYHRTDSFNLSKQSLQKAKKVIESRYGENYWAGYKRQYKTTSILTQEAHEAIRPTMPEKSANDIEKLEEKEKKLYDLIWRRFIATQMAPAIIETKRIEIEAIKNKIPHKYFLKSQGQTIKFEGFFKVYPLNLKEKILPKLEKEEFLKLVKINSSQCFTKPPARYSEATLIKALEKFGIGRPSTYAPIISTIQERNYIEKDEKRKLKPTEIGIVVNNILVEHFPKIVDINFTAKMEEELDEIAKGKTEWQKPLKEFYFPFEKELKEKEEKVKKKDLTQKTKEICPECGAPILLKWGRFGKFYSCSKFPDCKYTKAHYEPTGIICPKCNKGEIRQLKSKKGRKFYGCSRFPKCDFTSWQKPKQ